MVAVKTAILQHDHVLLNLTSIILSMDKNHDSLASFPARCLAAEMLSVEVKTKGEDGNVTRDTHHVNLEQAYRTDGHPPCEPRASVQNEDICSGNPLLHV